MKKISVIFITVIVIVSFSQFVAAHPGNTDDSGGHYNHSTGTYHYHHGYPEHLHKFGECPYGYAVDKTLYQSVYHHNTEAEKEEREQKEANFKSFEEERDSIKNSIQTEHAEKISKIIGVMIVIALVFAYIFRQFYISECGGEEIIICNGVSF